MNKQSLRGTTMAGIALGATLLSGVAAQASTTKTTQTPAPTVLTKNVSAQEQKSATNYWTSERMKNAISADRIMKKPASTDLLSPETLKGPDGARVDISGKAPNSQAKKAGAVVQMAGSETPVPHIGKVFFTLSGKNYVCSANSVISANKNTVSTAGHCLNEGPGAYATNFVFVPAYLNGNAPYGKWSARTLKANTGWTQNGSFDEDMGFAVMSQLNGRNLSDVVGASGVTFNAPRGQYYKAFGYPAAAPFDGQSLKSCAGTASDDPYGSGGNTQGITCDMTGGSSGGPWFLGNGSTGNQNSVNSYGYTGVNKMFGPFWDSSIQTLYQSAQA